MAGHTDDTSGQASTAMVESALIDDDPMVRRLALGAAERLGLLNIDRLRTALIDPAEQVVRRAVELAARSTHGPDLWRELVSLLNDDSQCEVSAFALGELPLDQQSLPVAVEALSRQATGHADPLARESAIAALGALGAGLEAVLSGTTDVATVRRRAVLALAAFDDERAETALVEALTDRDWQVRQAAEDLTEL